MPQGLAFEHPAWLLLLPLALLPWWQQAAADRTTAWLAGLPPDAASRRIDRTLRGARVLALAALVLALAGPHRPEVPVERTGTGAEIMLVLDRSRSMDQGFAGAGQAPPPKGTGPEALSYYVQLQQRRNQSSKGQVARTLLGEFAARRPDDRFAMVVFSTRAMPVLDFTQKRDAVQAAIAAGNIGRGLSETDIGQALQSALAAFEDRPYTGSRIVLLVSDGGDHLDPDVRRLLGEQMRRLRVSLYWIYIRSAASPGLMRDGIEAAHADTVPEHFLDRWFASIGVPYRAYEAEDGAALQRAIDDVDRLENLPIVYTDMLPRREFTPWALGVALAAVLLLLAAQALRLPAALPGAAPPGPAG
ncbi:vWA domain-containing protein [Piscinibacter sakaiensis]|uniref:MoxR-like ATPases n=1 Tax=Piscinibacter sakaiensis TaxID=1547922 RepID=A0A0K8NU78_PISS1|nr:vWA domain-containing protein [Piscinibacter sakaiensis]GAP33923.1 MoxR-like ATPases [Piscinibacter sakaiensis]